MNYQETLDWLFRQVPMYQTQGKVAYKADLSNTLAICEHLNHPENKFKSIHIAGTNGKGSCSHMLASIFQEAGYKTGLYTSPHLKDFRERIRINGEMIPEEYVHHFVLQHKAFFESIDLSFFEMTVGMAFQYFAEEEVDIAIIETGMGGRLDSTNVIKPELSIITNIGLDHTQFLGSDIASIAKEKAGIIKDNTPIIIGKRQDETTAVFEAMATAKNAPLYFAEDLADFKLLPSDLKGNYQIHNQRTVIAALERLKHKKGITTSIIEQGIANVVKNTGFLGRWQTLASKPLTICDTAHNKDGILLVLDELKKTNYKQLHIVYGTVSDKDVSEIFKLLPSEAKYYFCQPSIPRAMKLDELIAEAKKMQLFFEACPSPVEALKLAQNTANENDMILVFGSNFVVAEILP